MKCAIDIFYQWEYSIGKKERKDEINERTNDEYDDVYARLNVRQSLFCANVNLIK